MSTPTTAESVKRILVLVLTFVAGAYAGREWLRADIRKAMEQTTSLSALSAPTPPVATPPRSRGWEVRERTSPMDDTKTLTLSVDANEEVDGWPSQRVRPTLLVRCKERSTDVYVSIGVSVQSAYGAIDASDVRVRLDSARVEEQRWDESTDNQALFAPNAIRFARRLVKAQKLTFQFTPFNSSPAIVTFDLAGADTLIPKVATLCGWRIQ